MTSSPASDQDHLRRAIALAARNLETGDGGPFGAVIVRADTVLGQGANRVLRSHDPTAHAEIVAIRAACAAIGDCHLEGATLYTSCEPCPMCLAAASWARIARIVYAADRNDAASIGFIDADLYALFAGRRSAAGPACEHLPIAEAQVTMRRWLDSPFRTPY